MMMPTPALRSAWRRFNHKSALLFLLLAAGLLIGQRSLHAETGAVTLPPPAVDEPRSGAQSETAVFAGGCFWGVQAVFQHVKGVTQAVSGYTGGQAATADYETVSGGRTGHAESVKVTFDPAKISYGQLLQIYFSVAHDPTELNRQGPDTGTQYRSTIFPANAAQHKVAQEYIAQLNQLGVFRKPIATTLEDAKIFYPAENYHQDYLTLHPQQPYIVINDIPKVENLARQFPTIYSATPTLVGKKS